MEQQILEIKAIVVAAVSRQMIRLHHKRCPIFRKLDLQRLVLKKIRQTLKSVGR